MTNRIDILTQTLLDKPKLSDVSLQEIKNMASSYPWMAAAKLLFIKKLQEERDPHWKTEWENSSSYFANKAWASYLLEKPGSDHSVLATKPNSLTASSTTNLAQKKVADENERLFDPYHTVDYFASQGIQYKAEENPTDKFGAQLKSFTDWIKSMKRLPAHEIGQTVDPKEERKVERLAGSSLETEEVLTEAMAAVWIKQGNWMKAKDIYRKLSLLEPAKSAYFAQKISEINKSL